MCTEARPSEYSVLRRSLRFFLKCLLSCVLTALQRRVAKHVSIATLTIALVVAWQAGLPATCEVASPLSLDL